MGRKGLFAEKPKKGPGRKAKKQGPPVLSRQFKAEKEDKDDQLLSHRQKQRLVKRTKKQVEKKIKMSGYGRNKNKNTQNQPKKAYNSDESDTEESEIGENDKVGDEIESDVSMSATDDRMTPIFTDHNSKWLKPKKGKKSVEPEENGHYVQLEDFTSRYEDTSDDDDDDDNDDNDDDDNDDDDDSDEDGDDDKDDKDGTNISDATNTSDEQSDEEMEEDSEEDDNVKVESLANYSNESGDSDEEGEDGDDDVDDDEDLLPIEKKNRLLKLKQQKEAKEAEEEFQESMANQETFQFPDEDDETPVTLQVVQQRIKDISVVLADFNRRRLPDKSRQDYLELLRKDLCMYYSYNEFLMEKLMQIFPVSELFEYLEASEVPRPLTIRTNSLKTRRRDLAAALINRGVNLDPLGKWTKVGLVVYSAGVPLGATPEYLAGHYMIQGASSMLPVMALEPQENERVLDLCAAPGGKSSHIAALMKNTGVLFSNDANRDRIKAVVGNFHRLGIMNAAVSCEDGVKYKEIMTGFDRILVDAPCTGTGVISKDPSAKTSKSEIDVQRCYNLQRKLLLTAIDCLSAKSSTGGYVVYSTCSILPEENEWVIDYVLKKRNVKLVSTGLDFGTEGFVNYRQHRFHPTMKLTRRYYPHTHNMDGFFVAKLKKFSDVIPISKDGDDEIENVVPENGDASAEGTDGETNQTTTEKKKGKPTLTPEEKKRKQQLEQKNYVAKIFEKPQKLQKNKKPAQTPSTPQPNGKQKPNKEKVKTPMAESKVNQAVAKVVETKNDSTKPKNQKKIHQNQDKVKPKAHLTQISKKVVEVDSIPMEKLLKIKEKLQKPSKKQIGVKKSKGGDTTPQGKVPGGNAAKKIKKLKK